MIVMLPTRPYQLICEHRPGYLYVYIGSEVNNFEIAQSYWFEILSMLHRRDYKYVLVDKDVPPLAAADEHNLLEQLSRAGFGNMTLSLYDRFYERERCDYEEFAARDIGLNLVISPTLQEAETLLLAANIQTISHTAGKERALRQAAA